MVCLGFPLLTAGLVLGSYWAKQAWGDWWGWGSEGNVVAGGMAYLCWLSALSGCVRPKICEDKQRLGHCGHGVYHHMPDVGKSVKNIRRIA